jgi:hypothetical protein
MKRAIAILGILLVLVTLLIWLLGRKGPSELTLTPAGFTNNALGNPEALFVVRHCTSDVSWNIYALQQKSDTGWRNVPTPLVWSGYRRGDDYVLGVPVSSASNAWRVVLYCQERRTGVDGLVDRGKESYEKHVTKKVTARYDGRKYYVTNEVGPATP